MFDNSEKLGSGAEVRGWPTRHVNQKIIIARYMKKGKSATPLTCARNPFIFELRDSAEALVERLLK